MSRALPRLLAFLLVACGGRYSTTSNDPEGTGANGSAGTQAKTAPPDDDEPSPPGGGFGTPNMPQGGASTGTGGAATAGVGVGMGGTGFGFAGTPIGSAGSPASDYEICRQYCDTFGTVCPGRLWIPECSKQCSVDILSGGLECAAVKRTDYLCIRSVFESTADCQTAQAVASKLCGGEYGLPPPCSIQPTCALEVFGDGTGCHAITKCDQGVADLHCLETGGIPRCTCYINGMPVVELMTGAMSSKQACGDAELQQLCMALLL